MTGMLKTITNQEWGSDQFCKTKVYQIYIRSKLAYASPVYDSAAKSTINSLNSITTESLRIATGLFKSTPIEALHVLANEMRPQHKRDYLALRYYYKIKSKINNPAHASVVTLPYRMLFKNKRISLPLNQRIQDMLEKYGLRKQFVKPEYLGALVDTEKTEGLRPPEINLDLAQLPKLSTPTARYIQEYLRINGEYYKECMKMITDNVYY